MTDPTPPTDRHTPIMPYRAEGHERFVSPIDEVYGTMGIVALVLSGVTVSSIIGGILAPGVSSDGVTGVLHYGAALCGGLSWIVSLTLSIMISFKASVGRKWALLALAVNLLVVPAVVYSLC